ncbi:hypothetical protein, partial [Thiolapillus sp.]
PRSEAYFVFPLAQGTPGKQCGLAATGVYQPSLRSPWPAADDGGLFINWWRGNKKFRNKRFGDTLLSCHALHFHNSDPAKGDAFCYTPDIARKTSSGSQYMKLCTAKSNPILQFVDDSPLSIFKAWRNLCHDDIAISEICKPLIYIRQQPSLLHRDNTIFRYQLHWKKLHLHVRPNI